MPVSNDEVESEMVPSVEITTQMLSFWGSIWSWAVFLGLSSGLASVAILLWLGKYVFRVVRSSDIAYVRHVFLNPIFISFFCALVISVIANFYQLRFAFALKSALKTDNQESFEIAWLYFRNFAILFAVFILISATMLFFSTFEVFTGY